MVLTNFKLTCGKDIEVARKTIYSANPAPDRKKFPENHVFDADKSVRWNREEVARRNSEIDDRVAQYRRDLLHSEQNLRNSVIDYIVDYFRGGDSRINNFDRGAAEAIWSRVQSAHDDDAHLCLDEYLDLIDTVMALNKR
jgi:hypothetical protein